jgi:hypothetical protein
MMNTDVAAAMDFSDEGYFAPVRRKDWLELPSSTSIRPPAYSGNVDLTRAAAIHAGVGG